MMSSGKLRRGLRDPSIFSVSKERLFRFEKYARMRRVMLARQWCAVANECFAAMVINRQVTNHLFHKKGGVDAQQSAEEGEDQPGLQACSHGSQPGGQDGQNNKITLM